MITPPLLRAASACLALAFTVARAAVDKSSADIPADLFFQPVSFAAPELSPDGQRLAALARFDHRHYALALIDLETGKTGVLVKDAALSVVAFGWKSDTLLFIALQSDTGRQVLQSIDLTTGKSNPLQRLNDERSGPVADFLRGHPTDVICPWGDGSLRRVNVRTAQSQLSERAVLGITRWVIDANGTAHAGIGYTGSKWLFIWRSAPTAAWQRREEPGTHRPTIFPLVVMPDGKRLVVLDRVPGRTTRLAYFDLASARTDAIYENPRVDVTGVKQWGYQWQPAAAVYESDRARAHEFLPEAAECYRLLREALPDADCDLISFSRDEKRAIVRAVSDRDPGTFYLLDRKTGHLEIIGYAQESLRNQPLAASRHFEFKARDGLLVSGRITLPKGATRPPLVVRMGAALVGPEPASGFDGAAQFLASRGFASVIIHARGTDGFGTDFRRAGDLKITTTVIDDIEDGIAYVCDQGWADRARVGLLGSHSGGITAVHAALRGSFKVLVNFATPMTVKKWEIEELCPSDRSHDELTQMLGGSGPTLAYIKSVDPLDAAPRLRVPSFHYYPRGAAGHEMAESGRMLKAAVKRSEVPHVFHVDPVIKAETDPAKVTAARFEAMAAFLKQHL